MKKHTVSFFFPSILGLLFALLTPTFIVHAAEATTDYSVTITPTENQRNGTTGYFDLRLAANQSDRLPVVIKNNSNAKTTFTISFHTATTNSNGIVDYTLDDGTLTGEPQINISDLVTLETTEVTIAANSSDTIYVDVKMPETSFDGVLLGGIQVAKKAETTSSSSSIVSSEYQYVVAIQLSKSDTTISPDLIGGEVSLTQDNGYNAVSMAIENQTAVLLSKLSGTFTIINKATEKVLVSEKKDNLSIAPNSSFSLQTLFDNLFEAGTYTYSITLSNTLGEWTFSKDFTISSKDVTTYNATSFDEKDPIPMSVFIIIGLAFIILILLVILWRMYKKEKK